jgi:RecA-family ATPase
VAGFIEAIDARGIQPAFIVLDTLSRMLAGLNENDAADASLAIEAIEAIKRSFGCTVIVIHHTGKDEKSERGSSVFRAGFDTLIRASANEQLRLVTLDVTKQKDAEAPKPITLKGHRIHVADGVQSLAFSPAKDADLPLKDDKADPDHNRELRAAIHKYLSDHGHIGLGNTLTTKALAHASLNAMGEMPVRMEEQLHALRMREKALRKLSRGPLAGYIVSQPNTELEWALPSG